MKWLIKSGSIVSNEKHFVLLSLFCCALLLHFQRLIWENPIAMCFLFILISLQLLNFKWIWTSVSILLISLVLLFPDFPRLKNHANLEVIFSIGILCILLIKMAKPKFSLQNDFTSICFRIILVSIYFFSGFHKLNTGFFDTFSSCSRHVQNEIFELYGSNFKVSEIGLIFLQYGTIFIEMILPFGLFHRKTRWATAWILVFFHLYLCLMTLVNFSSLSFFLIAGSAINFNKIQLTEIEKKALRFYVLCVLATVAMSPVLNYFVSSKIVFSLSSMVFNIGAIVFAFCFFKNSKAQKFTYKKEQLYMLSIIILAMSFWSLRGYIGLGNAGNLTMYSNLATEKSQSNHFLIDTKKTKIWDFEEDNVLVLTIPDTLNSNLKNFRIPATEFKYQAKNWCKNEKFRNIQISCTLVYKNDTLSIKNLRNSTWSKPLWWYRFLYFRKIQTETGLNKCRW